MKKEKKDNVSKYIDVEASESEYSGYSISEDVGPSEVFETKSLVMSSEEHEEVEAVSEEVEEAVSQHSLLPTKFSPKIWLVRVKTGKEKLVLLKLFGKPQLLSVICKEDLKGYVYVEAFTKQSVLEALEDVKSAVKSRITLLPIPEMIDVFSDTVPNLEEGKFARVRSGRYKDDLVQILEAPNAELARVRMVPRIGDTKELFDPAKYSCAKSRGYHIYKKDCYKDGFLEKEILAKNLVPTNDLSFEEVETFKLQRPVLRIQDKVRVVRGDLKNVVGVVKSIGEGDVVLETRSGEYAVGGDAVAKYFDVGDEVCYKGQNGVVVSVSGSECVVLIGLDREVKVGIEKLGPPQFGGQYRVNMAKRPRIRRDPLLNKEVAIRVGKCKGYRGVVRDVYRDSCRVQLNTDMRYVNVARGDLAVERAPSPVREYAPAEPRTPAYRTPAYKTPAYKTPAYITPGYRTPACKTPTYGEIFANVRSEATSKYSGAAVMVGNSKCVLRDIRDSKYVTDLGEFDRADVEYVPPLKYDRVCVLEGRDAGKSGILVAVDNDVSVIRSSDGSFISVPFGTITKVN